MPLLNSIPPEHDSINVTMGCPLTGGTVYSLVSSLAAMQQRLREKAGSWYFYHREVRSIFANSLFRAVLTPEEEKVVQTVKTAAKYYIPQEDLVGGPLLDLVFRPVVTLPRRLPRNRTAGFSNTFPTSSVTWAGNSAAWRKCCWNWISRSVACSR